MLSFALNGAHRRIPPDMIDEVRKYMEQLLSASVTRKSKSPWASNVVLVRRKNNILRFLDCVDYRMLNYRIVKDAYAMPRIEEGVDVLHGSKLFTIIDMKSGYHKLDVADNIVDAVEELGQTIAVKEYMEIRKSQRKDALIGKW